MFRRFEQLLNPVNHTLNKCQEFFYPGRGRCFDTYFKVYWPVIDVKDAVKTSSVLDDRVNLIR